MINVSYPGYTLAGIGYWPNMICAMQDSDEDSVV